MSNCLCCQIFLVVTNCPSIFFWSNKANAKSCLMLIPCNLGMLLNKNVTKDDIALLAIARHWGCKVEITRIVTIGIVTIRIVRQSVEKIINKGKIMPWLNSIPQSNYNFWIFLFWKLLLWPIMQINPQVSSNYIINSQIFDSANNLKVWEKENCRIFRWPL